MTTTLDRWHEIVRARDGGALASLLADDVIFESPIVHTPQVGKQIATRYLHAALSVLNNESFRYVNEWIGPTSGVLEFATVIDGIAVNGVDIIAWNDAGLITHFKTMVRPLKAIEIVHVKMGELLAARSAPPNG